MKRLSAVLLIAAMALWLAPTHAEAAKFPNKPVRLVIPYSPGGSHDAHARAFASVMEPYLGQPMLAVIRAGGGGSIGASFVARSRADGHTLILGDQQSILVKPLLESLPYTSASFVPVGRINYSPLLITVKKDAPWKNLRDLIRHEAPLPRGRDEQPLSRQPHRNAGHALAQAAHADDAARQDVLRKSCRGSGPQPGQRSAGERRQHHDDQRQIEVDDVAADRPRERRLYRHRHRRRESRLRWTHRTSPAAASRSSCVTISTCSMRSNSIAGSTAIDLYKLGPGRTDVTLPTASPGG